MLVTKHKETERKRSYIRKKIKAQLETVKYDYSASVPSSHWQTEKKNRKKNH